MNVVNWIFGLIILFIGLVNAFWGNDPIFGLMIVFCSLFYLPPGEKLLNRILGRTVPSWFKIILGIFILWAALGVGELFDKVEMMRNDLNL